MAIIYSESGCNFAWVSLDGNEFLLGKNLNLYISSRNLKPPRGLRILNYECYGQDPVHLLTIFSNSRELIEKRRSELAKPLNKTPI